MSHVVSIELKDQSANLQSDRHRCSLLDRYLLVAQSVIAGFVLLLRYCRCVLDSPRIVIGRLTKAILSSDEVRTAAPENFKTSKPMPGYFH